MLHTVMVDTIHPFGLLLSRLRDTACRIFLYCIDTGSQSYTRGGSHCTVTIMHNHDLGLAMSLLAASHDSTPSSSNLSIWSCVLLNMHANVLEQI